MARRLPNQADGKAAPAPELPGGSAGVIAGAITEIPNPGAAVAQVAKSDEPPADVKVRQYRVTRAQPILYGGVRTELKLGKLVTSATYDVDYLKRQGVQLEDLGEI